METNTEKKFNRIVIVAYRLPFSFKRKEGQLIATQNSGGLVSAILSLTRKMKYSNNNGSYQKTVWVGKGDHSKKEIASAMKENDDFELVPVSIPENVNDKFYGGFCNDTIWPLFHYFTSEAVFGDDYFHNYQKANRLFYNELKNVIRPDDFIWIHDYQLFMLPQMIREDLPDASVSFFLHIPFPSYEVFRVMPGTYQYAILKGMLGADLIGFHTHDYAQHFIKSVRRVLGCEVNLNTIQSEGVFSRADAFPIGIDYNKFHDTAVSSSVDKCVARIRKQKKERYLIFSVDRLDYTKGFLQRLSAFELFLSRYPQMKGKVIFNMVMVPSRDTISRYQIMKKEIEATVGNINGKYGTLDWYPIVYQYRSLKFNEMIALYSQSDVGLITPIRDGMNLVAKEYVASQHEPCGMLVLSVMAGAAAELGEAILVNPTDKSEMADAIFLALNMPQEEKTKRIKRMTRRIKDYDVFSWADDIMKSTLKVKNDQRLFKVRILNKTIENSIIKAFQDARNPILFFDYDGTLVPIEEFPELAVPGKHILDLIEALAKHTRVVIISGRDKAFLDRWFSNLNVSIITEHGAYVKHPGKEWEGELDNDEAWKSSILPVLNRYINRCKGSFVEEKTNSLCWHYRNADEELANLRSLELKDELTVYTSNMPLQILDGHKVVEVKRAGYDKGTAAKRMLSGEEYDFVFAVGDDKTDEELFAALGPEAVTIKVGKEPTLARYSIIRQTAVIDLLEKLVQ